MRTITLCIGLLMALASYGQSAVNSVWSTTWGTSPEFTGQNDMPKATLAGKTIRQIIRPSFGGDTIRMRLSNFHSDEQVEIESIYVAWSTDTTVRDNKTGDIISRNGSTPWINSKTAKYLTFNGSRSVTIGARNNVTSDVLPFEVRPCRNLAITITYGEKVPEHATSHRGSRTTSYIADGSVGPDDSLIVAERVDHWYNILSLDIKGKTPVVAVLGNSITDGRGTTTNAQNRWTDQMATSLQSFDKEDGACKSGCKSGGNKEKACKGGCCHKMESKNGFGVINLGIGGNCIIDGGISQPLLQRYKDELSFHSGITHLIIYEGTNDIGTSQLAADSLAERLIKAYKEIINYGHSKGMKVYMATITPTKGNGWYSTEHDKARQLVNNWIRQGNGFEGVIDFDELVRDPQDEAKLKAEYSEDWLHLNPKGYEVMGKYAAGIINKTTNK